MSIPLHGDETSGLLAMLALVVIVFAASLYSLFRRFREKEPASDDDMTPSRLLRSVAQISNLTDYRAMISSALRTAEELFGTKTAVLCDFGTSSCNAVAFKVGQGELTEKKKTIEMCGRSVLSSILNRNDPDWNTTVKTIFPEIPGAGKGYAELVTFLDDCFSGSAVTGARLRGSDPGVLILFDHLEYPSETPLLPLLRAYVQLAFNTAMSVKSSGQPSVDSAGSGDPAGREIAVLEKLGPLLTHDFNNLVGTITGYVSLLKKRLNAGSKELHYAEIIETSSREIGHLVRRVLGFSYLDLKTLKTIDLSAFVGEALDEFRKAHSSKYRFELDAQESRIPVRASTFQLKQVLLTLLDNSIESMKSGGTVTCRTGFSPDGEPGSLDGRATGMCFVEVSDAGIGMDENTRRRMFDPFFTTKPTSKYTGLSLTNASSIIRHHNGNIEVDSSPGNGTRVRVNLPVSSDPLPDKPADASPGGTDSDALRVLVVDDEENVRQLAIDILTDNGYRTVTATNGREAIARLKEFPDVSVVILDMVMPVMDGKEACREIKGMPHPPRILICTGYSQLADLEYTLQNCADGFLQKPYTTNDLLKAVRDLIAL